MSDQNSMENQKFAMKAHGATTEEESCDNRGICDYKSDFNKDEMSNNGITDFQDYSFNCDDNCNNTGTEANMTIDVHNKNDIIKNEDSEVSSNQVDNSDNSNNEKLQTESTTTGIQKNDIGNINSETYSNSIKNEEKVNSIGVENINVRNDNSEEITINSNKKDRKSSGEIEHIEFQLKKNILSIKLKLLSFEIHVRTKLDRFCEINEVEKNGMKQANEIILQAKNKYLNNEYQEAFALLSKAEEWFEKHPIKKFEVDLISDDTTPKSDIQNAKHSMYKSENIVKGDEHDANKCIMIAQKALQQGNIEKAERFLIKAQRMYPTLQAQNFLKQVQASKTNKEASHLPEEKDTNVNNNKEDNEKHNNETNRDEPQDKTNDQDEAENDTEVPVAQDAIHKDAEIIIDNLNVEQNDVDKEDKTDVNNTRSRKRNTLYNYMWLRVRNQCNIL